MYEIIRYYRQIESISMVPAPAIDASTSAWVAAVIANGGSVSAARQILVNNLIVGLRTDGIFSKLDRLWLFAAENTASALTDIVADQLATAVSAPTFTANAGYAGSAAASLIDTNVDVSSAGGHYTDVSACYFAWANDSAANAGVLAGWDTLVSGGVSEIYPRYIDNNAYWRINSGTADIVTASTDAQGLWCLNGTNLGFTEDLYRNGTLFDSQPQLSFVMANELVFLNRGTTPAEPFTANCACGGFGGGLTATEASNLYTRLRTYMTAVGVP